MQRECYEIVMDEAAFREYLEWLPDCRENERFYCCLFMRKKYCRDVPWIKSDKGQLKRFTSEKERLFDKVRQLECPVGSFTFDGNPVPQESLALYISPNPRDLWKATVRSIGQLARVLECQGTGSNPYQEVMSEIQRTPGNRKFVMFDIDQKGDDILAKIHERTLGLCDIVETRGGYHVFVTKAHTPLLDAYNKRWYPSIAEFADVTGDAMTPPVGLYQGGFTPRFAYRHPGLTAEQEATLLEKNHDTPTSTSSESGHLS